SQAPRLHALAALTRPAPRVEPPENLSCVFFLMIRRPPRSPLFPSTTLFRSSQRHPRKPSQLMRISWLGFRGWRWLDRKSVVEGKRGDLGGRRIIKKKTHERDCASVVTTGAKHKCESAVARELCR